jgi:pimeloyl-ACP methyl ester carboxylesterase
VGRLALVAPFFDTFEGSRSAAALLLRTPVIGELVVHLVGDRALTDLSDAMALPADGRAALEHEAGEQLRFRGKRRAILANLRGDALRNATSCYEALEERDIPIVLVWGSLDRKIAEESMQRLRDLLPAIEYHGFAGAGHLVHYEAPERLNPILVRFLAG